MAVFLAEDQHKIQTSLIFRQTAPMFTVPISCYVTSTKYRHYLQHFHWTISWTM